MISFRSELLKAAIEAHNEGTLSRADLVRLRFATLLPNVLSKVHDCCAEQAMADGKITSVQGIDWAGLASFLKEILPIILPIILQLLSL
jgi:hypothetical protein